MSFFFFIVTLLTLMFSHFWARRTRPETPSRFGWTKNFSGNLPSFHRRVEKLVQEHPELLILEKTNQKYLISQSPSLFEFGSFYHLHAEVTSDGLVVKLEIQPKLISPSETKTKKILQVLENDDTGS